MAQVSPLFTWRSVVASERGPESSTTRHVLLTLSLYMSQKGDSCFPPLDDLSDDTGLTKRSVSEHLKRAHENGWIDKRPETDDDGMRVGTTYYARFPEALNLIQPSNAALNEIQPGDERGSTNHVNNKDTERARAREDDLPEHAPTKEQLIEYGTSRAGLSEEECKRCWRHYASVDWMDPQGRPISNWQYKVGNWSARQEKYSGDGHSDQDRTPARDDDGEIKIHPRTGEVIYE